MHIFSSKSCKYCCICKNWYDPASTAIKPIAPTTNTWGIVCDMYNDRKICLKSNLQKSAVDQCSKFECKL